LRRETAREALSISAPIDEILPAVDLRPQRSQKGVWWERLKTFFRLRHHVMVDREVLDDIFLMERKTLITLMLLETILLYLLVPLLGDGVFVWYGLILTLSLWRYYNATLYFRTPELNPPKVWHEKFVVQAWSTALLLAVLGLFAIPLIPPYYQLFVFIVIIGISTSVVKTLAEDQRTAIGYLLILLVPLIVEMLLLERREMYILAFLTVIYLVSQINFLVQSYERFCSLRLSRKILAKTKELLFEKQELLQRFFEQAEEGIFTYDRDLKILDCNGAFLRFFGFAAEQVKGRRFVELEDRKLAVILQASQVEGKASFQGSYTDRDGIVHWIDVRCSAITNARGEVIGGVGVIQDKTQEHLAIEELEFLASHDPLTGACNRRGLRQYFQKIFREEAHQHLPTLLFSLDIQRFKHINDLYGQSAGDKLLIQVCSRLRKLLPDDACLTRMGGDEFSIVIPFLPMEGSSDDGFIGEWIDQLESVLTKPYSLLGQKVRVEWTFGVVVIEPGTMEVDELIRQADVAMLQAKGDRKLRYVRYSKEIGDHYHHIHRLHQDLKRALKNDELELHFQPLVRAEDLRVVSAEALLRWHHPSKGLLGPEAFLPVARQFNQIADLDRWVLEAACRQIAKWKSEGNFTLHTLAVNLDAHLFLQDRFPEFLQELLATYGIQRGELTLEITEDTLVDNFDEASRVIQVLHEAGIECAIDDFGTGYSSLSYLKRLAFDVLKIDREFVRDMLERVENVFLLQTIIDMGKKLNYSIVVEGIENEQQLEVIRSIDPEVDCQGYYISKPLPELKFSERFLGYRGGARER
jgi:diguanylate cyclase (GGDEF)-like protein/PAS domain S-box-containing protein